MSYKYKMLGVVTLYHPDAEQAVTHIRSYAYDLERLIIWDNSENDQQVREDIMARIPDLAPRIDWQGNGENRCIAPAINYAWHTAQEQCYDLLLIMDQDSRWTDFPTYRKSIEHYWSEGNKWAFTPFVDGNDEWVIRQPIQFNRLFINSGTVIPIEILTAVGGADEALPLDALDHDLAIRIQKAGYKVASITSCTLHHTLGQPTKSDRLHLMTNNYNAFRTYSIARGHLINYRKHSDWLTAAEKRRIIKEYIVLRLVRILLLESDKTQRLKMLLKGIKDGLTYPLAT